MIMAYFGKCDMGKQKVLIAISEIYACVLKIASSKDVRHSTSSKGK